MKNRSVNRINSVTYTASFLAVLTMALQGCDSTSPNSRNPEPLIPESRTAEAPIAPGDLVRAARDGSLSRVKSLVERGASVDEQVKTSNGVITPLLAATAMGRSDVVQYLLIRKANPQFTFKGYRAEEFYIHKSLDQGPGGLPWLRLKNDVLDSAGGEQ
jgi:hypothetical protein